MAEEGQPSWLGGGGGGAPTQETSNPVAASQSNSATDEDKREPPFKMVVKWAFVFANMGFAVFLASTGALGIAAVNGTGGSATVFVGLYLIIFAAILFINELAQNLEIESLTLWYQKNFGFLFGMVGKAIFFLFCGILAFGMSKPKELALACGILVSAWGPFQTVVYFKWPEYWDLKEKYVP